MFLSRLCLNFRDRQACFDLSRPYEMHRTLWSAFPGKDHDGPGRILFRVDYDRHDGSPIILVQSDNQPNWAALPPSYLTEPAACKPLQLTFSPHQRLCFRLRANPTRRVAAKCTQFGGEMAGKRIGLCTEADQVRWLLRKGEIGGFRIPGQWETIQRPDLPEPIQTPDFRVEVAPEGHNRTGKKGFDGPLLAVRFDGILEVTNPNLFSNTLRAGIGSAKGFGFGLLSLARPEAHYALSP